MKTQLALITLLLLTLFGSTGFANAEGTDRFSPRGMGAAIVHDNYVYVLGGWDGNNALLNDVWRTQDLQTWEQLTDNAPWQDRAYHGAISYKGKAYVLGGFVYQDPERVLPDVWETEDFVNWEIIRHYAPWGARENFGLIEFQGQVVLLGGYTYGPPNEHFADIWTTTDMLTWHKALDNAPWGARRSFGLSVIGDKLYLYGGFVNHQRKNDVWVTEDLLTWTRLEDAPWSPRGTFKFATYNDQIWVMGGGVGTNSSADNIYANDVWSGTPTAAGIDWSLEAAHAPWEERGGSMALELPDINCLSQGSLAIIGGLRTGRRAFDDAWITKEGINWEER